MENENPNQFRLWNPAHRVMVYPQTGCRQFLIGLDGQVFDGNGCPYDENYKVLRWTGLVTDDAEKIYEGDIIEYYLGHGFATMGPYRATLVFADYGWQFLEEHSGHTSSAWKLEDVIIIGNIYEDR